VSLESCSCLAFSGSKGTVYADSLYGEFLGDNARRLPCVVSTLFRTPAPIATRKIHIFDGHRRLMGDFTSAARPLAHLWSDRPVASALCRCLCLWFPDSVRSDLILLLFAIEIACWPVSAQATHLCSLDVLCPTTL